MNFPNRIELIEEFTYRLDWSLDPKEETVGAVVFVNEENQCVSSGTKILEYRNSQIPPFKVKKNFY